MADLQQRSLDVIRSNQAASGGYIACPNMADYAYCWFRDGAFIAYAMDVAREHESARRFYQWGADVINRRGDVVARAVSKAAKGEVLDDEDYLHTRYTLEGEEGDDEAWPNFQLDGIGTWLWGLEQHGLLSETGAIPDAWIEAAVLAGDYLEALWAYPNYDLWEEFGDKVHPYTLAAIFAGLNAATGMTGDHRYRRCADAVRRFTLEKGVAAEHFVKYLGTETIDASLLGLAVPYGLVEPDDARMKRTVARIERELRKEGGGVRRYAWDSYYGGGEWLLLAAWLGWYYVQIGETARATDLLGWIENQSDADGNLPEQVPVRLNALDYLEKWEETRGPIANPLLWSHAMYLILDDALCSDSM